jgi:hypothetical protein
VTPEHITVPKAFLNAAVRAAYAGDTLAHFARHNGDPLLPVMVEYQQEAFHAFLETVDPTPAGLADKSLEAIRAELGGAS